MRRIGILTSFGVPNYGALLQAYALRNTIEKITGDETELIKYQHPWHLQAYYGVRPLWVKKRYINPNYYIQLFERLRQRKEMKQLKTAFFRYFDKIPGTNVLTAYDLEQEKFDVIVLGSDIIWSYNIPFFGNDSHMFGNQLNAGEIISYAASFGQVKSGMTHPEYVKEGLTRLKHISVRDDNSKILVKEITGRDCLVVLDPTFLWDFKADNNCIYDNTYGDYIFVYGGNFSDEMGLQARKYADAHNIKLICTDSDYSWCDMHLKESDLDPFRWVSLVNNSLAVMTSTYHGLLFSLQAEKRIIFQPTQFILDKALSLIDELGIGDPLIRLDSFEEKINWEWDYSIINPKIDVLRTASLDFLMKALIV